VIDPAFIQHPIPPPHPIPPQHPIPPSPPTLPRTQPGGDRTLRPTLPSHQPGSPLLRALQRVLQV